MLSANTVLNSKLFKSWPFEGRSTSKVERYLQEVVELSQGRAIVVPRVGRLSAKVLQQALKYLENSALRPEVDAALVEQLEDERDRLGQAAVAAVVLLSRNLESVEFVFERFEDDFLTEKLDQSTSQVSRSFSSSPRSQFKNLRLCMYNLLACFVRVERRKTPSQSSHSARKSK